MKIELARAVPRLKRLLPAFRKINVAIVGDVMLDRYIWGNAHRLSPEAAVPVVDFVSQNDCPGGAGNVAANLAALGARVQTFGVVGGRTLPQDRMGDDEVAVALRACLRRAGIGERGVLADPQRITTLKTRIIARHQQIVRIDHERQEPLGSKTEEKLFRLLLKTLKTSHALLISDYDKGLLTDGFAERVLNAAHKFKVPVFVKPKTSRLLAYRGARAIVCNAKEASFFVTRALNDDKSLEEAGRAPRHLTIPATSFEVTYARVGQPGVSREATGRQVFDVTGAGDTVLSVLALAMAAGADLPDAAYLANIAAGVVVGKLGTASVSPVELSAALDEARQ
jgi:rfaE bifunctional protein kinase chain/domain